jgi:hypothetical protein
MLLALATHNDEVQEDCTISDAEAETCTDEDIGKNEDIRDEEKESDEDENTKPKGEEGEGLGEK